MKQTNHKIWRISSVLTLILCLFVSSSKAQAPLPTFSQGTLTAFPVDLQLYPRIRTFSPTYPRGYANVTITGSINQGVNFNQVRLRIFRDNDGLGPGSYTEISGAAQTQNINTSSSAANFSFTHQLPSELNDYRYALFGVNAGNETLLADADGVVAGDAFIIHGQSNAEAPPFSGENANADNPNRFFVRVYGNSTEQEHSTMPKQWFIGDGTIGNRAFPGGSNDVNVGNVGQWGIRFASELARTEGIPICIFNGAYGADIRYFQKNYNDFYPLSGFYLPQDNNYTRLLNRTQEAGLQSSIRAIIWWQGESNMGIPSLSTQTSKADYLNALTTLFNSFASDYTGVETYLMFQVKLGCFNQSGDDTNDDGGFFDDYYALDIMQAQFEFARDRPNFDIISTNGVDQLNQFDIIEYCHYRYDNGYKQFGERAATIIRQTLYGLDYEPNTRSFGPIGADFSGIDLSGIRNKISIKLYRPKDTYTIVENPLIGLLRNDFRLEGNGTYNITATSIAGDILELTFSRGSATSDPTGISYFGHSGLREGSLINGTLANPGGGSLLSFLNFPISPGTLPADPLSLTVSRTGGAHQLRWKAESNERFDQFVVERGETRNSFKPIYEVYGTGQNGTIQYDFTDNKPNATVSHYRIRAIQQDGKELFSQVVTVNNRLNNVKEFRVYPNPVAGSANATINMNEAALATINLHDASGRLLSSRKLQLQKGNNQFSLGELLDYNPGTYIVRVVTATETQQIRVVKAK